MKLQGFQSEAHLRECIPLRNIIGFAFAIVSPTEIIAFHYRFHLKIWKIMKTKNQRRKQNVPIFWNLNMSSFQHAKYSDIWHVENYSYLNFKKSGCVNFLTVFVSLFMSFGWLNEHEYDSLSLSKLHKHSVPTSILETKLYSYYVYSSVFLNQTKVTTIFWLAPAIHILYTALKCVLICTWCNQKVSLLILFVKCITIKFKCFDNYVLSSRGASFSKNL